MGATASFVIRPLRESDLPEVVRIHQAAFAASALTRLGPEALRRYYRWQCEPLHDSHNLVAERDGQLLGFCFSGRFVGAVGGFVRENLPFLVLATLRRPELLLGGRFRSRVRIGLQIVGRLARRSLGGRAAEAPAPPAPSAPPRFGILAIATDPARWGSGVGQALMRSAQQEAERRGAVSMGLVVDPGNERAVRFYEQLGWRRVSDAAGGAWRGEMALDLLPTPA